MKKLFIKTLIVTIFLTMTNFISASNISTTEKNITEKLAQRIEFERKNYNHNYKVEKYESLISLLVRLEGRIPADKQALASYLKILLENQFAEVLTNAPSVGTDGITVYSIPNVDIEKVRTAWLERHNQARANVGKAPYTRNSNLERTAHDWADHLASIRAEGGTTHKRPPSTAYYDYNKIKDRFANKGVKFDESKGTAFTENNAYQYYSCNKADCTQDLINAIKKGRDFFIKEASYNGPHYKGIVHPNFTEIGMGIGFNGTRYYIVTHYAVDVL